MQKKRNSRGISHHLLLPIMAVLLVAGIGGYIMQRGSNAASKPCVQRTFSTKTNSSSACVSYIIDLMKASGKASKAKSLTSTTFGTKTAAAVKQFQSQWTNNPDGIVSANATTWSKLCSQGKSGAKTAWTKAGCGGASTSSKKGWTSLGQAAVGKNEGDASKQFYYWINLKVCKIPTSQSDVYKLRFNEQIDHAYAHSDSGSFWLEAKNKTQNNKKIASINLSDTSSFNASYKPKSLSFTSSTTVSSTDKVYVRPYDKNATEAKSSLVKQVSTILTCK